MKGTTLVARANPPLRAILLAITLCGIGGSAAGAQAGAVVTIAPEAEVRVTPVTGAGPRATGHFVSLTPDTLTFARGKERARVAMPTTSVQRLEVRGPRDRKRGSIIGGSILGGIAVVFGGVDVSNGSLGAGEYVGTILGNTLIGALAGAALAPRGWTAVPAVGGRE